jgi:hypothetical protein
MPALTSRTGPSRAASNGKGKVSSWDNVLIVIMVAAHSLQLLQLPLGGAGEVIGAIGTIVALIVSLFSTRTMFLMLFGLNFLTMSSGTLSQFRVYILIYFIYAFRVCATPSVYQLILGNSPASRVMRRWLFAWLGFAVLAIGFFLATANEPFGISCAWDVLRGLGTSLLACILAVLAFDDIQENSLLPAALAVYVLMGSVWITAAYGVTLTERSSEGRLGYGMGADPNALGLLFNVGIGMCLGIILLSRSWLLRILAVAAVLQAAAVIVHTQSRAAVLTGIVMVAVALCVNVPRFFSFLKRLVILAAAVAAVLTVAMPLAQEYLLPRIQQTLDAFQASNFSRVTAGRTDIFYTYWERTVGTAFMGAGFDYSAILHHFSELSVAHNTWLQILSDFGVAGFALFVVMTLPAFKLVFREVWLFGATQSVENKKLTLLRTGTAIAVAGLLMETCTLTSTFEIPFWWCMGCAVAFECRYKNAQTKNRPVHAMADRNNRRR